VSLGIADQVRTAFLKQSRTPAVVGAIFGGLVPLAAFAFSHFGAGVESWEGKARWAFVALCLLFSAPKVYKWGCAAFSTGYLPRVESAAFALLLEGAMTLADHSVPVHAVVSYACLLVLVTINALATACSAALDQKALRAAAREQARPEAPPRVAQVMPAKRPTVKRKPSAPIPFAGGGR
jgi:hypothetical protein